MHLKESMKMDDRRRFTRIVFNTKAKMHFGSDAWPVKLYDLSLKGALIERNADVPIDTNHAYHLSFKLEGSDIELLMSIKIVHIENDTLGVECSHIGIDSAAHLKRLIELNIGDDALLNRDIEHLSH